MSQSHVSQNRLATVTGAAYTQLFVFVSHFALASVDVSTSQITFTTDSILVYHASYETSYN